MTTLHQTPNRTLGWQFLYTFVSQLSTEPNSTRCGDVTSTATSSFGWYAGSRGEIKEMCARELVEE